MEGEEKKENSRRTFAQRRLLVVPRPVLMCLLLRQRNILLTRSIHRVVLPNFLRIFVRPIDATQSNSWRRGGEVVAKEVEEDSAGERGGEEGVDDEFGR
jgi:hypothetical protein